MKKNLVLLVSKKSGATYWYSKQGKDYCTPFFHRAQEFDSPEAARNATYSLQLVFDVILVERVETFKFEPG